jgi:hypothetical protein
MFNPVYPFTKEVLEATVKRGCLYFVRNTYSLAFDHFQENIKGYFMISHYNDEAKAKAHYNSLTGDTYRFFYDWENPEHQKRLYDAASYPVEYRIFSTYFHPDYKKKITKQTKDKINTYMYKHTNWKPQRGEMVNLDFFIQFGDLYATMSYAGQQIKVKFEDIETHK